ncbi:MAG: hypothetical protein KAI66_17805 [Lentisphaeria bacterium]|nr:hypothetical protein [Lentisphaeria bacterium]
MKHAFLKLALFAFLFLGILGPHPVFAQDGLPLDSLRFYAPFDDHARGVLLPMRAGIEASEVAEFATGKVGQAASVPAGSGLDFAPLIRFLSHEEGTVAVWLKINWEPSETATRLLIDLGRFASLRRWREQQFLTYSLWYHHLDEKHDYSCTWSLDGWGAGQWRHVALTWSWKDKRRVLFVDGEPVRTSSINRIPNIITLFRIGPDAELADELYAFDCALTAAEVKQLHEAGVRGRPACPIQDIPKAAGASARIPVGEREPPPAFVNWSFDGAEQRDNGQRGEITMHGWWRWQCGESPYKPPASPHWLYRKVPNQSHYGESFPVLDKERQSVPASDSRVGSKSLAKMPQWCEREFGVPKTWRGRRIILALDSLIHESAIYLNGELLAALPKLNLGGDYDITDKLRWDVPNRLTLFSSGVDGDISLRSVPVTAQIQDAWLVTSWRRKEATVRLEMDLAKDETVRTVVRIFDGGKNEPAKQFEGIGEMCVGSTNLSLSTSWPEAQPWSPKHPKLYTYTVTVYDRDDVILDETLPQRFGFREIWMAGGDFYLNGKPFHFIGHSNAHLTAASEIGDADYVRYSLEQWRKAGVNTVTPWQGTARFPTFHPLLDIADEMGMVMFPLTGIPTGEHTSLASLGTERRKKLYARYIRRYRQHPSVLCWMVGVGAHNFDFCPGAMDGRFSPKIEKEKPLRALWDFCRTVDDTRPCFGLSSGDLAPVWTSMAYQGFGVELQERENWPLRWATKRHKPLMPCEFSLPYYRDWFARGVGRTSRSHVNPAATRCLATEFGAMFLGSKAYANETPDYLKTIGSIPGSPTRSWAYENVKSLFADTLKAWRAYGISFVYHAEIPYFFTGDAPTFPLATDHDPRRKVATPESLRSSLQARDELSAFGKRVREATEPLMAFIGGPGGQFTRKNHAFWAGENVEKALVVVNDTEKGADITAEWTLQTADGETIAKGTVSTSVPAGRRDVKTCVIRFQVPSVDQRTDCILSVSALANGVTRVAVRPFALTVFPRPAPPAEPAPAFCLFDPVGDTREALRVLGVASRELPDRLDSAHLLVIGRHALEQDEYRTRLKKAGFDQALRQGMRVLIFEQGAPEWEGTVMGLRLKRLSTRRTFVRCPKHPVLQGLANADFHHLRGDSDLIGAYAEPASLPKTYPTYFWHWGNDNIVATYVIEKPQVGAARALVDCGFDLAESALLEIAVGEGIMMFCQIDVTNRIGKDPASTALARNLLRNLSAAKRTASGSSYEDLLARNRPKQNVDGYLSPVPKIGGLHGGNVFFRKKLRVPAFDATSASPLFLRVRDKKGGAWITSLSGAKLNTPWQQAKRARIETVLRFVNGERVATGPELASFTDRDRLYPHTWNKIPGMSYAFDPYTYYRW